LELNSAGSPQAGLATSDKKALLHDERKDT